MGLADFAGSNSNGWPTGPVSTKKSKAGEKARQSDENSVLFSGTIIAGLMDQSHLY